MLKEIFETKEEEVTGDWKNFCSEEYNLVKNWSLTYAWGEGDLGIDMKIILKHILKTVCVLV